MKTFSLYVEKDSLIHRIDPINKILYVLTAVSVPLILPSMAVSFLLDADQPRPVGRGKSDPAVASRIRLCFSGARHGGLDPGVVLSGEPDAAVRPGALRFYVEGLMNALRIVVRVITIVAAFLLLVLTTRPADLVEELVRRGLSPRLGYVLASIFQILPQMIKTTRTIMDAQRSRGLETEGNLWVRVKAFLPLIGPVVMSSLIHAKERALALEVRGIHFEGKRTWLREKRKYPHSRAIGACLLLVLALSVVWRILG